MQGPCKVLEMLVFVPALQGSEMKWTSVDLYTCFIQMGIYSYRYVVTNLHCAPCQRNTYTIPARSALTIIPYGCRNTATSWMTSR